MDWILVLAMGTFGLLIAFLLWTRLSTKRHQATGMNTSGIGGKNDPIAGATEGIRGSDAITGSLNAAAAAPEGRPRLHR